MTATPRPCPLCGNPTAHAALLEAHLDKGLGWTRPTVVACCRTCGTELARHHRQHTAERTARRTRCPVCGTRAARRLPGTTNPATDLALTQSRWVLAGRRWPPAHYPPARLQRAGRR